MRNTRRIKRMKRNRVGKITEDESDVTHGRVHDSRILPAGELGLGRGYGSAQDREAAGVTCRNQSRAKPWLSSSAPRKYWCRARPPVYVADVLDSDSPTLNAIAVRLDELKENVLGPNTLAVAGSQEVTILADRSVPFGVVKKIMSTCTGEGYENVSLAVIQKASQVAAR